MADEGAPLPVFRIDRWSHWLGGLIQRTAGMWQWLGDLESRHLDERLADLSIDRPLYVTGLARAGTTIVLEMLAQHPAVATHQYRDFPSVFTPFLWNRHLERAAVPDAAPVERAHRDGIMVTPESPEAIEEVLWMRFFPHAHDPTVSNVLDETTCQPRFESFYRDHLRKILLVRGGTRYLAKANYNVTRLRYLRKLFGDTRFVILVRSPAGHVASLMRQHALFERGVREEPRARAHLRRIGHFEFGPDFRPINVGDSRRTAAIIDLLDGGEPVRAWARYWDTIYRFVAKQLADDAALGDAPLVLRFEDLCRTPRDTCAAIMDHCGLSRDEAVLAEYAGRIKAPTYYDPCWSTDDLAVIRDETRETAARFGYE